MDDQSAQFKEVTEAIEVNVRPQFVEDESDPEDGSYCWAYVVTIVNRGKGPVQLLGRRWEITDARGVTEYVAGPGVVGVQPVIAPGESYEYMSFARLTTPSGLMVGAYVLANKEGQRFNAAIPAFSLDCPYQNTLLH